MAQAYDSVGSAAGPGAAAAIGAGRLGIVGEVIVAVVILAVAVLAIGAVALIQRSRLTTSMSEKQIELDTTRQRAEATDAELRGLKAELNATQQSLDASGERLARTDVELRHARQEVADAVKGRMRAEERATSAETRFGDLRRRRASVESGETDAALLWALEKSRSQRTWSHGWAPGSPEPMPFEDRDRALHDALQAEVTAARETAGVIIDLDAELPEAQMTEIGCLLVLRAAQELLADVSLVAEVTTLVVRATEGDISVTVHPVDEDGQAIPVPELELPESPHVTAIDSGVLVHDVYDEDA